MSLGVYIQVPFCQTRCTYCNFHTGVVSPGRFAPYAAAVCREILGHREFCSAPGIKVPPEGEGQVVDTVYIGGGTPSLLEPELLARMLDAIRGVFQTELR